MPCTAVRVLARRALLVSLLAAVFAPTVRASAPPAQPVRVVCIGDSITQGRGDHGGGGTAWTPTESYRYPLWKAFVDAGTPVEFVGSRDTGFEGTTAYAPYKGQTFPNRHEGYWGWTATAVAGRLAETSKTWVPDIALVLLGTNREKRDEAAKKDDPQGIKTTVAAIRKIVATLRAANPRVAVVIGLPFQEWEPFPEMGRAYKALAAELTTPASPVVTAEHEGKWVSDPKAPDADTVDWVHPTPHGDAKVAAGFYRAVAPLLGKLSLRLAEVRVRDA
jgi:lysophospholipase L1-like esterase